MNRNELISNFSADEVETAEDLLHCLQGPVTADKFRRLLLLFLQGHYSSADNYEGFEQLSCYVWTRDKKTSRLTIRFTHNSADNAQDEYPGIYLVFGKLDYEKLGIGNYAGSTQDSAGTHIAKEATLTFSINHVFKNASDAYDAAEMTSRILTSMGAPLARNGGANGLEVLGLEVPKEKKPSPENYYTVATNVRILYTLAVTRTLESHRIRRITQILTVQA